MNISEMDFTEAVERIAKMPPSTPENSRYRRAEFMFTFLVDREAWFGCRDWDGLSPRIKAAFMDALAYLESAPMLERAASTEKAQQ